MTPVPDIIYIFEMVGIVAFAGGWLHFVCQWALRNDALMLLIGLSFVVTVRLLTVRFDIRLQRDARAH